MGAGRRPARPPERRLGRGRGGARVRRAGCCDRAVREAAGDRADCGTRGRAAAAPALVRQLEQLPRADRGRRAPRQAPAPLLRTGSRGGGSGLACAAWPRAAPAAASGGAARRSVLRVRLLLAPVGGRPGGGHEPAAVLHPALRGAARHGGPRELPALGAARPGDRCHCPRHPVRGGRALAGGHPRIVLLRAQPGRFEREHGLLPRDLPVRRPEPLRAPCGARDRRGPHAARHAALASMAPHRPYRGDVDRPALLVLAVEHGGVARDHGRARSGHR